MRTQADTSQAGVCSRDESEWLRTDWHPRRDKLFLILMAIAVIIAIAQVFAHRGDTVSGLTADDLSYHNLALRMLSGREYNSTHWAPGYPAFLALIYAITGPSVLAVYFVQALLFVLTLALLYRIALFLTKSRGVAVVTVLLCLVRPSLRDYITMLYTESLSSVMLAAFAWLLLKECDNPKLLRSVLLGFLAGAICITKCVFVFCLPVMLVFAIIPWCNRKTRIRHAAFILAITMVFAILWCVRHYRATGGFVMMSTASGYNLWLGNYPGTYSRGVGWREFPPDIARLIAGKSAVEENHILARAGLDYIRNDPPRAIKQFGFKFGMLWLGGFGVNPLVNRSNPDMPRIGSFGIPRSCVSMIALFALAVYGWFALPKSGKRRAYPIVVLLICWSVTYIATLALRRYVIPVIGFEYILASVGLWQLSDLLLRRRLRKAAWALNDESSEIRHRVEARQEEP